MSTPTELGLANRVALEKQMDAFAPEREHGRGCGLCSLCCRVMIVPGYVDGETPCRFLRRNGKCGTYETRPIDCSTFACAWLLGIPPRERRPDKVGYVTVVAQDDQFPGKPLGAFIITKDANLNALATDAWSWLVRDFPVQFELQHPGHIEEKHPLLAPTEGRPGLTALMLTAYVAEIRDEVNRRKQGATDFAWGRRIHERLADVAKNSDAYVQAMPAALRLRLLKEVEASGEAKVE